MVSPATKNAAGHKQDHAVADDRKGESRSPPFSLEKMPCNSRTGTIALVREAATGSNHAPRRKANGAPNVRNGSIADLRASARE